jgi:hypothetical protein
MAANQKFHRQLPPLNPYSPVMGATMTATMVEKSAMTTPMCRHLFGSNSGNANAAICRRRLITVCLCAAACPRSNYLAITTTEARNGHADDDHVRVGGETSYKMSNDTYLSYINMGFSHKFSSEIPTRFPPTKNHRRPRRSVFAPLTLFNMCLLERLQLMLKAYDSPYQEAGCDGDGPGLQSRQ